MKKIASVLLSLMMIFSLSSALAQELELNGALEAEKTITVSAPFTAKPLDFSLRAGDTVSAGDVLMTLDTDKVYATASGTVNGCFAAVGDDAATVVSRYGALLNIMPENSLVLTASTRTADTTLLRDVYIGQTIYLKTSSGAREGEAVITSVSGMSITAEVLESTLRAFDNVSLYKTGAKRADEKIGDGSVARAAAIPVAGNGTVVKAYFKNGDAVKRGDLLFETAGSAYKSLEPLSGDIVSPVSGYVATISAQPGVIAQENTPLLTLVEDGGLIAFANVQEDDLPLISVGDAFDMTLDLNESGARFTAIVESIGRANAGAASAPVYRVTFSFQNDAFVREGMQVTLTKR